jgi:hypothetical protein
MPEYICPMSPHPLPSQSRQSDQNPLSVPSLLMAIFPKRVIFLMTVLKLICNFPNHRFKKRGPITHVIRPHQLIQEDFLEELGQREMSKSERTLKLMQKARKCKEGKRGRGGAFPFVLSSEKVRRF